MNISRFVELLDDNEKLLLRTFLMAIDFPNMTLGKLPYNKATPR